MSKENDYALFSLSLNITDRQYMGFTERERDRWYWLAYFGALLVLLSLVFIVTIPVAVIFSIPILAMSNILVCIFHSGLLLSGRKGLIYCEDELDGCFVLLIESGLYKPRYWFRKSKNS